MQTNKMKNRFWTKTEIHISIIIILWLIFVVLHLSEGTLQGKIINTHFGWLIINRAFVGEKHYRWYEYFGYFQRLIKSYWLWLPVACLGIMRIFREWLANKEQHTSLFIAWIITILGLLSITKTKVSWYIMPIYPALAIVSGYRIGLWLNEITAIRLIKWFSIFLFVSGLCLLPFIVHRNENRDIKALTYYLKKELAENEGIVNYKLSDWTTRIAVRFYTDRAFENPIEEKKENFVIRMNSTKKKVALCKKEDYQMLVDCFSKPYPIIYETENLILFTNY
ncbi:MAG: hypothetical protein HY919_06755 [Elusimicrobia bacterium]|nr:hypothetical protein [Elusimicrobiota bacterium]